MRNIFLLSLIYFLFSCNGIDNIDNKPIKTKSEKVNDKIIVYIKNNANDPKSYEPISTQLEDSMTYLKKLDNEIDTYRSSFDMAYDYPRDKFLLVEKNKFISLKKMKDSLQKAKFKDFTESYTFIHECRIKNGFGGLIKTSFKVVTDTNLNIINVTEVQ